MNDDHQTCVNIRNDDKRNTTLMNMKENWKYKESKSNVKEH